MKYLPLLIKYAIDQIKQYGDIGGYVDPYQWINSLNNLDLLDAMDHLKERADAELSQPN